MASNRRFILLIYGVKLDEVRAEISPKTSAPVLQSKEQPACQKDLIDYASYNPCPRLFVDAELHPKKTNLLCWNCSLSFDRVPRFIALDCARASESPNVKPEWTIMGNFCSWACAATYIVEHYVEPKRWALLQNLAVIRSQIDGSKIRDVQRAPSKIVMSSYAGESGMSQQDYSELAERISQR